MPATVSEKLLNIVEEIESYGSANLTRLTVLKKWFERPDRLSLFGLLIAKHSAAGSIETSAEAAALLRAADDLLAGSGIRDGVLHHANHEAAKRLHERARDFQNEVRHQQWSLVRTIHSWPLLLVEKGLALYLGMERWPSDGYKLAADFSQHYDTRHGNNLNGPSRDKVLEIVNLILTVEAWEADGCLVGHQ